MKYSKNLLAAALVTTIAAGSVAGIGAASAHNSSGNRNDDLISKLAQKFGVEEGEVKAVFDEQHEAREAERDAKRTEHLQSLVDNGTLTAEQKTALEAKFEEMHVSREALRSQDLSREEKRAKMQENRAALKAWAKEQGIDLSTIRPEGGEGQGGHGRKDTGGESHFTD